MSDEKVIINADEYAAMRKELVGLYLGLFHRTCNYDCGAMDCRDSQDVLKACPIAAKLSEEEGGNG